MRIGGGSMYLYLKKIAAIGNISSAQLSSARSEGPENVGE